MGSEIQSERSNQNQDLRELQDTYRKRRQAVEAEGQSELEKTRKENHEKLKAEVDAGEAVVNHVRNGQKEKIEQLKSDTDQKLVYERKNLAKRYQTTKEYGNEEVENLEDAYKTKDQQLHKELSAENKREAELHAKSSGAVGAFAQDEAARRALILKKEQEELNQFHQKVQSKKSDLTKKSEQELSELNEKNHQELKHLQESNHDNFRKQTEWSQGQLKLQNEQESKTLEAERQQFLKNQLTLRARASEEMTEQQDTSTKRIGELKKQSQFAIEKERDTGTHDLEKTRAFYDKNISTLHKKGDEEIHNTEDIQDRRITLMEEQQKEQLQKLQHEHEDQLKQNDLLFKKQEQTGQNYYRQALIQQRKNYDEAFKRNMKAFETSVHEQREKLLETLVREKREVMGDIGRYNNKNSDPFYRITQPKAELKETNNNYIVEAQVPEHERENVKVIVHADRVVVEGSRRFEDQVEDTDSKLATHNYQTFRQEIPLEHPVREKFVQTSWDNGIMTVRIPKA